MKGSNTAKKKEKEKENEKEKEKEKKKKKNHDDDDMLYTNIMPEIVHCLWYIFNIP
jgi:hypothetical protein